ncbi:hypothetical protein [Saccharopolyspora rosea]|uniref:Uncharacterized protein n=1 Tax=Saccharopolyspora rosea TaxID=524884 RepID=A0ABW3FYP5_9PSEU|nr:hypothetical protein [Saccharopolyspora rosea]
MPVDHPDPVRRWWWRSPLPARLLPALGLLGATATALASALPSTGADDLSEHLPSRHTTPAHTAAPLSPTPTPTPTSGTRPEGSRTPHPATTATTRPTPASTAPADDWVPVVVTDRPCDQRGDFARTANGAAASCEPDDHGRLRWTTQW